MVQLRHAWVLPHGQLVRGDHVWEASLVQGSHGRRGVDRVQLPAHVEAWRRAGAVVVALQPLVGARVFEHLRGVVVVVPIHGFRGSRMRPARRGASELPARRPPKTPKTGVSPPHHVTTQPSNPLAPVFAQRRTGGSQPPSPVSAGGYPAGSPCKLDSTVART